MTAAVTVDAGKPLVQITAVDKTFQHLPFNRPMDGTTTLQFVTVLVYTLIEWTDSW